MNNQQQDQLYRTIGIRIRQAREKLKLSQDLLAKQVSVSRVSIVNIEKGQQHTPIHVLFEIARALEIELVALFPSLAEVFGETAGIRPSRIAQIEEKTAGNPKGREGVLKFVQSITSNKRDLNDDSVTD